MWRSSTERNVTRRCREHQWMIAVGQQTPVTYWFRRQSMWTIANRYVWQEHLERTMPERSGWRSCQVVRQTRSTWLRLSVVLTTSTPVLILLLQSHVLIRSWSILTSEQNVANARSDSLTKLESWSPSLIRTLPRWRMADRSRKIDICTLLSIPTHWTTRRWDNDIQVKLTEKC